MKALVTGGGGFLGRYVVEALLDRGEEVSSFSRSAYPELEELGATCVRGNLRDPADVREAVAGHDVVFHVAGKIDQWGRYEDFHAINVEGTRHVVDACRETGVSRLVHSSSASVVFDGSNVEGGDESLPYPDSFKAPYPKSKARAERIVLDADGRDGLTTTVIRPHLIWGPRDPSLAPELIERGREGTLPIIGDGENVLDLTHVRNAAHGHVLAADADADTVGGEVYFVTDDDPVEVWPFLQDLFDALDVPPIEKQYPYRVVYALGAVLEGVYRLLGKYDEEPRVTRFLAAELAKSHWFDISKAKTDLGYEPVIGVEEGFEEYVEHYRRTHGDADPGAEATADPARADGGS